MFITTTYYSFAMTSKFELADDPASNRIPSSPVGTFQWFYYLQDRVSLGKPLGLSSWISPFVD